jgi:threonine synthase
VAGIVKYKDDLPEGPVVCTVTGHGLKDPDTATRDLEMPGSVRATLDAVTEAAGLA